jgi:hypothetical protein
MKPTVMRLTRERVGAGTYFAPERNDLRGTAATRTSSDDQPKRQESAEDEPVHSVAKLAARSENGMALRPCDTSQDSM